MAQSNLAGPSPSPSGAASLVIGLDGADLSVIEALGPQRLPNLFWAMRRGAYARQQSVMPPATLPNWATFLTGVDPGVHGVFDFTTRQGYEVRFTGGSVRQAPTLFRKLDARGLRTACLFFPGTYPPERLQHGSFASGWDAPVAFSADASFMWPRALHAELVQRFGAQTFDDVDEFHADAPGFHAKLADALVARIDKRAELSRYLLEKQRWDVFGVYFGETDTASHHLWSLWDTRSPRHPAGTPVHVQDGLPRVYEAADRALGMLLRAAGAGQPESVELTIVSDHGSGGSSDKVLYLNRVLEQASLLRMRDSSRSALPGKLKNAALRMLPPRARELIFRAAGTVLPSWLESRVRFASIDFRQTFAFSDELNYLPAIHYNLRGREPNGQLEARDIPKARRAIEEALFALRDPWTGEPVVRAVHAREELYTGPSVDRAPDLLLELELDQTGYSYNCMPSAEAKPQQLFRKLERSEHLGRKGRSLAGSHRAQGLFVACGPRVLPVGQVESQIADATATLLARLDVQGAVQGSGRVLPILNTASQSQPAQGPGAEFTMESGTESARPAHSSPHAQPENSASENVASDERRVAERLRNLGYID